MTNEPQKATDLPATIGAGVSMNFPTQSGQTDPKPLTNEELDFIEGHAEMPSMGDVSRDHVLRLVAEVRLLRALCDQIADIAIERGATADLLAQVRALVRLGRA